MTIYLVEGYDELDTYKWFHAAYRSEDNASAECDRMKEIDPSSRYEVYPVELED